MSFMDRDNIIEEGLFDKLKDYFKDRKKYDKLTKILMKDPKVKDAVKRFNDAHDDLQNNLKELRKKYGLDK